MNVISEVVKLIQAKFGTTPDTEGWVREVDKLYVRGVSNDQILSACKAALDDNWHAPRIADKGLFYINKNLQTLIGASRGRNTEALKPVRREQYTAGRHERWEVEMHKFENQLVAETGGVNLDARKQFVDSWMAQHYKESTDIVDCPVCQQEEARNVEEVRAESPGGMHITG